MTEHASDLAGRAAAEVINLHMSDKPPCERYQAVLCIVVAVLGMALAEQRDMLLTPSDN